MSLSREGGGTQCWSKNRHCVQTQCGISGLPLMRSLPNEDRPELKHPRWRKRTSQDCIFNDENQWFCVLCRCIFHQGFLYILPLFSSSYQRREMDSFCSWINGRWILPFHLPPPNRSHQFNSRIVSARFASQITWNNREMIEMEGYIFRSRSLCLQHRPCLRFQFNYL